MLAAKSYHTRFIRLNVDIPFGGLLASESTICRRGVDSLFRFGSIVSTTLLEKASGTPEQISRPSAEDRPTQKVSLIF